jgi:hypothetical protein
MDRAARAARRAGALDREATSPAHRASSPPHPASDLDDGTGQDRWSGGEADADPDQ